MNDAERGELLRLITAGDLHALMLAANRIWVRVYCPASGHAVLVVDHGDRRPATQNVVVIKRATEGPGHETGG